MPHELTPAEIRDEFLADIPELPALADDQGPIPRVPPIATDEQGRIIPMSDTEWAARSEAMSRVLRILPVSQPEPGSE